MNCLTFLNLSDGNLVGIGGEYAEGDYAGVYKRYNNESTIIWESHGNIIPLTPQGFKRSWFAPLFLNSFYVSLSGNGKGLAVGTIEGSDTSEYGKSYDSLVTQVYRWDAIKEGWIAMGEQIIHYEPYTLYDTGRSIWPSRSIVLSEDATVLAIGSSSNFVDVYFWNETVKAWILREVGLNNTTDLKGLG